MSRVKMLIEEVEDGDLPGYCMICGTEPAAVQHPDMLTYVPFPLSLLGVLGRYITPKKIKMSIPTCAGCAEPYRNEKNMGLIWDSLKTVALVALLVVVGVDTSGLPRSLIVPMLILISTWVLQFFYFSTVGRKAAVRLANIDRKSVALDIPGGQWGVHYTKYKQEKETSGRRAGAPKPGSTFAPTAPTSSAPVAPTAPVAPVTPPTAAPASIAPPSVAPPKVAPPSVAPPKVAPPIAPPMAPPSVSPPKVAPQTMAPPTVGPPKMAPPKMAPPNIGPPKIAPPVSPPTTVVGSPAPDGSLANSHLANIPDNLPEFLSKVALGDLDVLESALQKGSNLNEALPNGMNALHIVAISGEMQLIDALVRRGIPVNSVMQAGLTPLHLAIQCKNQSVVGMLLAKGANPNQPNEQGYTPLHWCAAVNDERLDHKTRHQIAELLRRGGGDVTLVTQDGKTPYQLAVENGHDKVAETFKP